MSIRLVPVGSPIVKRNAVRKISEKKATIENLESNRPVTQSGGLEPSVTKQEISAQLQLQNAVAQSAERGDIIARRSTIAPESLESLLNGTQTEDSIEKSISPENMARIQKQNNKDIKNKLLFEIAKRLGISGSFTSQSPGSGDAIVDYGLRSGSSSTETATGPGSNSSSSGSTSTTDGSSSGSGSGSINTKQPPSLVDNGDLVSADQTTSSGTNTKQPPSLVDNGDLISIDPTSGNQTIIEKSKIGSNTPLPPPRGSGEGSSYIPSLGPLPIPQKNDGNITTNDKYTSAPVKYNFSSSSSIAGDSFSAAHRNYSISFEAFLPFLLA